jgi:copper(I)-binding protein
MRVVSASAPDRLTGIDTPVAARAVLHESFADNGVMKMRPLDGLTITPGEPLILEPGGKHVMLMGLNRALQEGDSFPITLTFERAGAVTATAIVERAGATHPMQQGAALERMQHH